MRTAFVLDTSVAISWCFEDEANPYSEAALGFLRSAVAHVPVIWPLEVVNVLLVSERRKRLTRSKSLRFLEMLQSLPIKVDAGNPSRTFGQILVLAREQGLTSYDASYLDLAAQHGFALATLDARLRKAAKAAKVPLWKPSHNGAKEVRT